MTGVSQGFPPSTRLQKTAEYKKVFSNPVKLTDRYFTLLVVPNDLGHPRIGLAIAKKMVKRAVDRNAIKRIVRESFRMQQDKLNNLDIVVLVKKETKDAKSATLRDSLNRHWSRLTAKCA